MIAAAHKAASAVSHQLRTLRSRHWVGCRQPGRNGCFYLKDSYGLNLYWEVANYPDKPEEYEGIVSSRDVSLKRLSI
ncbi:MAG: hypothetical protein ACP5RH_14060 [Leptodesmis sp.]|uniref:hypothetical protein n=1 Tax=Leptodesmis sp. TaxID=3100501 RepID=UPI003D0E25AC